VLHRTLGSLGDQLRLERQQTEKAQSADDEQGADERPALTPVPPPCAAEQECTEERSIGEQADELADR